MQVTLTRSQMIAGVAYASGAVVTLDNTQAKWLVDNGWATALDYPNINPIDLTKRKVTDGSKAYLMWGVDHPGPQGNNGLFKIATERGIKPYCAVNTDGTSVSPGVNGEATWSDLKRWQTEGVEIQSHGCEPHINSWQRTGTGAFILYSGNGTAASIAIAGTFPAITLTATVTGQSDGTAGFGPLDLTQAGAYSTLALLAAYINAQPGWSFTYDPCLTGTEASNNLLKQTLNLLPQTVSITVSGTTCTVNLPNHGLIAGQTFTLSGATPAALNGNWYVTQIGNGTTNGQDYFQFVTNTAPGGNATVQGTLSKVKRILSAGASLVIAYKGDLHNVYLEQAGSVLRIMGNGVLQAGFTLSGYTLSSLAAAINAAGVTGLTAALSDDRRTGFPPSGSSPTLNGSYPYCHGAEPATNLENCYYRPISRPTNLCAGLSNLYIVNRRLAKSKETAAANGMNFEHFSAAGMDFNPWLLPAVGNLHGECRIVPGWAGVSPIAIPVVAMPANAHFVFEPNSSTGHNNLGALSSLGKALAASRGFALNVLCHAVTPDGTSGYTLGTANNTQDLTEQQLVAMADGFETYIKSGDIIPCNYSDFSAVKGAVEEPPNYLFNSIFANYGGSLLGLSGGSGSDAQIHGVYIASPALVTAMSVDSENRLTVTTNAATSTKLLTWVACLQPGVLYEVGGSIEVLDYTSGQLQWLVAPLQGQYNTIKGGSSANPYQSENQNRTGQMMMQFTLHPPLFKNALVIGKAGPFNVPTASTVKIKINGGAVITGINLAGATPTATTANEVATAINAAFATAVAAGTYDYAYRSPATVIGGKVMLISPEEDGYNGQTTVVLDTGSDQVTPVFGNSYVVGEPFHSSADSAEWFPVAVTLYSQFVGTFRLKNPYLRRVKNI